MSTTRLRKDVWTDFRERGFAGPVNPDEPNIHAHGGIHVWQVRRLNGRWEMREQLRDGGAVETSETHMLSEQDGESLWAEAVQFNR